MRLIFMGNPEFAVPSLDRLAGSRHTLLAVVSNPPKRMGRGRDLKQTAVGDYTRQHGLKLIQPKSLKDSEFHKEIRILDPDLVVVVAYRILPQTILDIPRLGAVNLHASLLPAYRGAAPIQWALMRGEAQTGLTTFLIRRAVDTGNILLQHEVTIGKEDTYGSLAQRMSIIGSELLLQTVNLLEKGTLEPKAQDPTLATKAPKIQQADCRVDWSRSAEDIHNQIRGLVPRPGAFTILDGKRVKIFSTGILKQHSEDRVPGEIVHLSPDELIIQTGSGQLSLNQLQLEGKRSMTAAEFLRGYSIRTGKRFGE